jgi:Icc protein
MRPVAPPAIVQLTDPHMGAQWSEDPAGALARAIDTVHEVLSGEPAAVIVSGDVANRGTQAEYAQARAVLDRFAAPVYVVAGNHDDRDALRRHFPAPSHADEGYFAVDAGPARLVALDTKRAGSDAGELGQTQLAWLESVLSAAPATPTLVAMHHLPLPCGMPAMDAIGLPADERAALEETLSRHPQVHVVACGHVHRTIVGRLGAASVLALPSTDVQLKLDFASEEIALVPEPPCVGLHVLIDGRLVSHVQPVLTSAPQ